MNTMRGAYGLLAARLALGAGLFAALSAAAQWKDWDYDLDQEKKSWQELQAQIPAYPKPDNLLKFDAGASSANTFFVDAASVSVGDDGVVRYTLMVKTGGGATNVSFEGIRCETRELKVYAFGRPNSEWSRARDAKWRYIEAREINNHHLTLHREYFCPSRRSAAPLKQIVQTLKSGPPRRVMD
jgi:CNP1-like family